MSTQPPSNSPWLSRREREVFELIASGYSTKQVADRLSIKFRTANLYRERLYKKLKVHTVVQMVHRAYELGALSNVYPLPPRAL